MTCFRRLVAFPAGVVTFFRGFVTFPARGVTFAAGLVTFGGGVVARWRHLPAELCSADYVWADYFRTD